MWRETKQEIQERDRKALDPTTTHYLFFVEVPRAVGGGKGGGASFAVPGNISVLGGAADGQGVDAVCVAVTVTAVLIPPTVARSPHKDWAQTATTLQNGETGEKNDLRDFCSLKPQTSTVQKIPFILNGNPNYRRANTLQGSFQKEPIKR